tara:strand:- start:1665 stop:2246 length:582 start_codon:yes stop_codon:yes gene_type:complete
MTCIIETPNSKLILHQLDYNINKLIEMSVLEVKTLLIVKPEIRIYGKIVHQQRNVGFFSNGSKGYYYSKKLMKSQKLTLNLEKLLEYINSKFNSKYNGILINYYEDGTQYISKHSDDEKNLDDSGVVSVSYGEIRKFRIRDKKTNKIIKDIPTEPDKIIQMTGNFQKEFTHEIPVEKKIKGGRYSFTFRKHLE